jgi:tetratricopeptide (TPR) repeat protein
MSDFRWRHLFVSRDDELAWLQAAWREAKKGRPQFRVLLGESGVGKTRLVQEFYRWLSREEDPAATAHSEGYWPDAFTSETGSLDVNPDFPTDRAGPIPQIPWLWWGLRWPMPERRNEVASGCALIDFRANLEPHIRPILAARRLLELRKDAGWKIASVLSQAIPILGWLTTARDLMSLMTRDRREERRLIQAMADSAAEQANAQLGELETQVLETFRVILDPKNTNAPTVPVIVVLDDAQWADSVTLRFVLQLLQAARQCNWSLLVIATHWEAEWKANVRDGPVSTENPTRLTEITQLIGVDKTWSGARVVPPIADLGGLVSAALPGLFPDQKSLILAKAGGNPRLLEEIFHHFLAHPQLFEGGDASKALTKKAEQDLRGRSFDYHELVDKRFCRLEEHVRRALGWSSAQGMRFPTSITEAIARRVAPKFDHAQVRPALEAAEDPHSLVQLFRDHGRFNLGEFRQAAFQHVARENLAFDDRESVAVDSALREVLATWLRGGSDDTFEDLEPAERRDALAMALRTFSPDQPETRGPWAIAMAQLASLNASEYLWKQALRLAQDLADEAPAGWSLEELPGPWQFDTISVLIRMRDLQRAHRLATSNAVQALSRSWPLASESELRNCCLALTLLGDVELALGRHESALAAYQRGLEINERLIDEHGETPQALRDKSVSLDKVGSVQFAVGDRGSALAAYQRSLEINERLLGDYGESPEALRDVWVSLVRIGELEHVLGVHRSALASYRRGLAISERLLAEYGETPEALADVSMSLNGIGDEELALGERGTALAAYRRGLEITERLLAEYGETPDALRDVLLSLSKVGDVELELGERASALAVYRRGLELCERLIAEYGETPQALRDVLASLERVGIVELKLGNRESALAAHRRGLEISERLLAEYSETPGALHDLATSLARIGDMELEFGERGKAFAAYRRGLETSDRLLTKYGETPQALRDVWVSLDGNGNVERALGKHESALATYGRALEVSERLIAAYGETPQALSDVCASLDNVADVEHALGKHESALATYRRALKISERLIAVYGETPQALHDVSVSLSNVGEVELALGRRESALAAHRRSLEISERLIAVYGETCQALRNVSVSLNRLGDVEHQLGRRESALAAYRRSLEISERVIAVYGETPQALRDVWASVDRIGGVEREMGESGSALAAHRRGLGISERLIAEYGETPGALHDLSMSLARIGEVGLQIGEPGRALAAFHRSLATSERIVAEYGETPEALRDVWVSLVGIGDVELALEERASALVAYRRSLEIMERLIAAFGESPKALRDVSVSLDGIGDVELALGESESALAAYDRSLKIRAQLVADCGKTPQSLRDLIVSEMRLARVSENSEAIDRLRRSCAIADEIEALGWAVPQHDQDRAWIDAELRLLEEDVEE